jgi:3-oxoadipate enol-lactonase
MGGTLDSWDQVLPALNNGRRVVRYDTRGAGLSEKIKGAVTWDQMAGDVAALLDSRGITGRVALAGIAVGAAIAVHFAVRYPDRAAALVLHGPAVGVGEDRRQATLDRAAAVESGGMRGVVETSLAASYPSVVRHDAETFAAFRARWLANDPESFAAINRMLAAENIEHELTRITCPTLVTAGRHDSLRPPSIIEPMSRQIQGAQFLELNSGHFASVQTPGLVSQAIHYFLHAQGL